MKKLLLLIILMISTNLYAEPVCRDSHGRICRSHKVVNAFKVAHPCPDTGSRKTCKNYIVDHAIPLACAKDEAERQRLDSMSNMQWQTKAEAKAKDKIERKMCGESD